MSWFRRYPLVEIALIMLFCVHFEYHTATWSVESPGLGGGLVILGIIGIVLAYQIVSAVEELCLKKGWMTAQSPYRYDLVVYVAIVAVLPNLRWFGPLTTDMFGNRVPEWEFGWVEGGKRLYFVLAVMAAMYLLRVLHLLQALNKTAAAASPKELKGDE
jgi:hypothetical protein